MVLGLIPVAVPVACPSRHASASILPLNSRSTPARPLSSASVCRARSPPPSSPARPLVSGIASGDSKVSYSKRRTSWPVSVLESPNRSYIPKVVIMGLVRSGGSSQCDFWSRGQSAGVSQISHTTTSTPDAAIASPDMGGCPPWRLHRVWAPGSDVARADYDPQGCKSGQKHLRGEPP